MSATFAIAINAIRTTTIGNMPDVIKEVDFTVTGTQAVSEAVPDKSFSLPQTTALSDPNVEHFLPLAQVAEADVVNWIEANFGNLDGVKAHIQYVLDREVAKASLAQTPMPWAPTP